MSVIVSNLTKVYGTQKAVNNISFEAKKGEILGFLGPNGAGKTTTMKMITCFIPQTAGRISVCGYDVVENPIEVRRRVGYLPEHNPLYLDMYVKEYLLFVAGLHKVNNKMAAVEEMIERTGLTIEQHKLVGSLSKGYRQRVGLAQAMLHNPDVLILDEPTSGLDPNQLIEIRKLIREFGKEKTVIFSSHIMQEVQALCDRVIIINQGNMVANDTIEMLQSNASKEKQIMVTFAKEVNEKQLKACAPIQKLRALEGHTYLITSLSEEDIRPAIFNFAVKQGNILLEMHQKVSTIEDVFQEVTNYTETKA
ncbi:MULTISPECIES: gliding motility-associated ABC transporter ATP-binding subunit GldA [unclassified Aureispira]|uniref:gliding motility-associated ABC transporter ATP-binding subunit GldA n=1 Tax=unclassified Aureispira TaxID=2649989 RepID=UPI000696394E|nr:MULTISPECIES: gliding motility-associated ABC transporter ATP-binding subunit GldA [unclassified Aureispira]WMX15157.1 gliding motility-associated ABC transporter ATP-binding subunit GldA [Aureispira sp. CCB-E]